MFYSNLYTSTCQRRELNHLKSWWTPIVASAKNLDIDYPGNCPGFSAYCVRWKDFNKEDRPPKFLYLHLVLRSSMAVYPPSRYFCNTGGNEMELTMNTRREIIKKMAPEYQKATKKEKRKIWDELVHLTRYTRTYASWLLLHHGRKVYLTGQNGKKYRVVGTITKTKRNRKKFMMKRSFLL